MVSNSKFFLLIVFLILGTLITSCGGGGGGGSIAQRSITQPHYDSETNLTQNSNTGSYIASDYEASDFGSYNVNLASNTSAFYGGESLAQKNITGNFSIPTDHLSDTAATSAWTQGWTGQNTSIHIIDDFNTEDITINLGNITTTRVNTTTGYNWEPDEEKNIESTWSVIYRPEISVSHGWLVSKIAGGDMVSENFDVDYDLVSRTLTSCDMTSSDYQCYANYVFGDLASSDQEIVFAPGIAKDATVLESNVSSTLSYSNWYSYLSGHIRNSSDFDAVNLSWGVRNVDGIYSYSDFTSGTSDFADYSNTKSVFVVAAGNDGAPCTVANFADCNLLAVDLALDSSLGDQVIVAGALNSDGTSIATYSNRAGVLKDRFLLANGDTGYDNTALEDVVGTSFAAPRITGAAALLKSKFQNLTGAQAADILLLTADKDINDDGSDDFSGVSDVYGHGELDTGAALSPIGNLYSY